ncbi:MAG: hypothetical protein WDO69_27635 [Pseudomonadota bacterium]
MTNKPEPPITDAMVDETLDESFPASDPPGWTLGHEPHPTAVRLGADGLLALLSPDELARVAALKGQARLPPNEEYIDLTHPERGVLIASADQATDLAQALPRSALSAETWARVQRAAQPR